MQEDQKNSTRNMMSGGTYGDNKMDKSSELNSSMSIAPSERDQYGSAIHSVGGANNG